MAEETTTFTIDDNVYELSYNIGRIKIFERNNIPVVSLFRDGLNVMTVELLSNLTAVGIKLVGGNYVTFKQGVDIAEHLIEKNGMVAVFSAVGDALQRDCDFLFIVNETI